MLTYRLLDCSGQRQSPQWQQWALTWGLNVTEILIDETQFYEISAGPLKRFFDYLDIGWIFEEKNEGWVRLSAQATLSATSCWQAFKTHLNRVSSSLESTGLMVPNVVFTQSRWGWWEQSQTHRKRKAGGPPIFMTEVWGVSENIMSNRCYHW